MRILRISLPLSFVLSRLAFADACATNYAGILDRIYTPNVTLLRDAERGTADPYWGRLSQAMSTTPEADLRKLFSGSKGMTAQDIDDLWWKVMSGELKSDHTQQRLVTALRDFAKANPDVFNKAEDVPFRLLERIKKVDVEHGFGDASAVKTTSKALDETEETLLLQALQEVNGIRNKSSKFGDNVRELFTSPADRLRDMIDLNNDARKRMQHVVMADEPVADAMAKYSTRLDDKERKALEGLITNTNAQLADTRELLEKTYGRQLSYTNDAVRVGDIRLQDLHKGADLGEASGDMSHAVRQAESDMDVVDSSLASARKRAAEGPRPWPEYTERHLEIRNTQHARETAENHAAYYTYGEKLPKDSDYKVDISWTVTVQHQKTEMVT
jgi:hypothetical protein